MGKRVLVTGAMRPERFVDTDAHFNLGACIGALNTTLPGVYLCMNGRIHCWSQVERDMATGLFIARIPNAGDTCSLPVGLGRGVLNSNKPSRIRIAFDEHTFVVCRLLWDAAPWTCKAIIGMLDRGQFTAMAVHGRHSGGEALFL